MKSIIHGNIAVLTSTLKYEDLKKATKRGPVQIKDKDGQVVYSVNVGANGALLNPEAKGGPGAVFSYGNKDGFACVNLGPAQFGLTDGKITPDMLETHFGLGMVALQENEEALGKAVAAAIKARENLMATIETA